MILSAVFAIVCSGFAFAQAPCGVWDDCLLWIQPDPVPLNTNATTDSGLDGSAQLATDGQGTWLSVWISGDTLGGTVGSDYDIFFVRSTDDGVTWPPPVPLNSRAAFDIGGDTTPHLATDRQGNWLALWSSEDSFDGTIGTDYDIIMARSTDNGITWTTSEPLNSNAASDSGDDFWPQVTTDGLGNWVAVWHSDDSLGGTIGNDRDILFSRSVDNGISWTAPASLKSHEPSESGTDSNPQIATDGQGGWLAVWHSSDMTGGIGIDWDILLSRSNNNGVSWSDPVPLNSNAASDIGFDSLAQLTTDGQGNWVAVWISDDTLGGTLGDDDAIFYSRSADNGQTWATPLALNPDAAVWVDASRPQITTDGQGTWVALWSSNDSLGGALGEDSDILTCRSTDNGLSWTPLAPLNGNAASDSRSDLSPQLTTDGQGLWLAAWHTQEDLGGTIGSDYDILIARLPTLGEDCGCNDLADLCEIDSGAAGDCNGDGIPDVCEVADCNGDPACEDCQPNGIPDSCELTENDCNANLTPDECDPDADGDGVPDACDICPGDDVSDCQPNGIPDGCDISDCTGDSACADCQPNGIPDGCELADNDCDANLVPDDCQPDTDSDADGVPDFCDQCSGADDAIDCQPNGIPDACDISGGTSADLNGNDIPDDCEDCNANGLPDEFDLANQTSPDCNANEVPDECEIGVTSPAPGGPYFCTDACDPDCNDTGVPDACELAGNDCNANAILDDCETTCCALDPIGPTGSDCACATGVCHRNGDILGFPCADASDCAADETCEPFCTPTATMSLSLPKECHDVSGTPLEPITPCLVDADCETGAGETCQQSFRSSATIVTSGSIDVSPDQFGLVYGDRCTLNQFSDNVGWYELLTLVDETPGTTIADTADDCFVVTIGLCCSDPPVTPVWPWLSRFRDCPCFDGYDVESIGPIQHSQGLTLDGYGGASLSHSPCDDENYSGTFMVPPGDYAYQIRAQKVCAGTTSSCDLASDCAPGVDCAVPDPDYTAHFKVESCALGACCVGGTCLETTKLDCANRGGVFFGESASPVTNCVSGTCATGACCLRDGTCDDSAALNTQTACTGADGLYLGGLTCADNACLACTFENASNCQEVQTVFGPNPLADRNPDNGPYSFDIVTNVVADDIIFNGTVVDEICWYAQMYTRIVPVAGCAQGVGFDDTWEIRVYESDATGGIPGTEVCFSTLTVLNKLEGTGQATSTWAYSGQLDTPCSLPNGGVGGDKYWVEISAFGDSGCLVHAIWSRDDGNDHAAWKQEGHWEDNGYSLARILNYDIGFCEDDGITVPDPVLGSCCTCTVANCTTNVTLNECLDDLHGKWVLGGACGAGECISIPSNDDCANAEPVVGIPAPLPCTSNADCNGGFCDTWRGFCYGDGFVLVIAADNICATNDGPLLDRGLGSGCGQSIGSGEMHDDIWYSYVAEHCGRLRITSCYDADLDQIIAIYDGDASCPLVTNDELACNDDGCTGAGGAGPSAPEIDVTEGQNLLIRVGGWNNEVPGGFWGDPHGFMNLTWSFIEICTSVLPPVLAPPPHDILKNRYISVDALTPNLEISEFHLRLTMTSTLVSDAPTGGVYWANQPDVDCISQVTPTKPSTVPGWTGCSTIHLAGCPIIPTSTYDIHAVSDLDEVSDTALVASTQAKPGSKWWGDVVGTYDSGAQAWTPPQGSVNIDDAVAAIKTYQDPNGINATHVSVTDIHPHGDPATPFGTPNKLVNIADVFAIILGFQGKEFPGPDLDQCPG